MIPRHPFDRLSTRATVIAATLLGVSVVLLTLIILAFVSASDQAHIAALVGASSADAVAALLADWTPRTLESFSFLVGFDYLYDIVHNNAVALFVIWGGRRVGTELGRSLGSLTAWTMWLDTALNLFENVAFLYAIRSPNPWPLLAVASTVFTFRSLTLGVGVVVGVALHGWATWNNRRAK